jgi:peptidoglycan/LPS O-acetylase OafA/YrhL
MASMLLELHPIGMLRRLLLVDFSAYFIAGALCFLIWSEGLSTRKLFALVAAWALAIEQVIRSLPALEKYYATEMNTYAVCAIVSSFFAMIFLISVRRTGFLRKRQWLTIGAMTYPLYLVHQYIAFMVFNIAYPSINAHVLMWGTLVIMMVTAFAIHRFVEQPVAPRLKTAVDGAINRVAVRLAGWRVPAGVNQPG